MDGEGLCFFRSHPPPGGWTRTPFTPCLRTAAGLKVYIESKTSPDFLKLLSDVYM